MSARLKEQYKSEIVDAMTKKFGYKNIMEVPKLTSNVMKIAFTKNAQITENPLVCDYFLEKGDYLKLDLVSLGYTFKFNNKYVDSLRLSVTGKNLLTFTSFTGVDPSTYSTNGLTPGATGSRNYYPTTRQFLFGLQLGF